MARKGRVGSSPTPGTKIANKYRPHSTATRFRRLLAKTEGMKAIDITTASVGRYKTLRLKENVAPATVNRELAALKRMFRLGLRQRLVATLPDISMLAEHSVRKGFFELWTSARPS